MDENKKDKRDAEMLRRIQRAREHYDTRASRRPKQTWDHLSHQWQKVA